VKRQRWWEIRPGPVNDRSAPCRKSQQKLWWRFRVKECELRRSHVPTICLERDVLQPNYTSYIRSDNEAIGRMAGGFIVDYLKQKYGAPRGVVVQIRGLLGVEGEINRDHGAKAVLAQYPKIKVVAEPVADWIQAKAKDRMAVGAYLAAKELGRDKEMAFVGVDGLGGPGVAFER
jgi:ribose transport system substrate-binding protein